MSPETRHPRKAHPERSRRMGGVEGCACVRRRESAPRQTGSNFTTTQDVSGQSATARLTRPGRALATVPSSAPRRKLPALGGQTGRGSRLAFIWARWRASRLAAGAGSFSRRCSAMIARSAARREPARRRASARPPSPQRRPANP